MAQTVITKKPADRKPKATKPTLPANSIDLGEEDEGPVEFPVHFLRDDEQWYPAHLPKGTLALSLGEEMKTIDMDDLAQMTAKVHEFVRLLFNRADADAIIERLNAPDDRLDLVHVRRLINRIAEKASGLPTT